MGGGGEERGCRQRRDRGRRICSPIILRNANIFFAMCYIACVFPMQTNAELDYVVSNIYINMFLFLI